MQADHDVFSTAGARRFFDYWHSLPKIDLVPDRKSFNPPDIASLMPAITLLEIWSHERIDLRLIGTGVARGMGIEPTGKNYLDLIAPEARAPYLKLVDAQINQPCGRRTILKTRNATGLIARTEALTLPMFHAQSGHHMIVSYFEQIDIVGYEKGPYEVLDFEKTEWLDIGAGVPGWI
ncbi:MAG TPA: PAS domain-containing protein [Parvibaculum sp.]